MSNLSDDNILKKLNQSTAIPNDSALGINPNYNPIAHEYKKDLKETAIKIFCELLREYIFEDDFIKCRKTAIEQAKLLLSEIEEASKC